MQSKFISIGL